MLQTEATPKTSDATTARHRLVAVEHGLTREQLHRTASPHEKPKHVDAWLEAELARGRITRAPSPSTTARIGRGPCYRLVGHLAQPLLRSLAETDALDAEVARARALYGERSFGHVTRALQRGDLTTFDRLMARRGKLAPASARSWLRASIVDAFDPTWLKRIYGDDTASVVTRVLTEALVTPTACAPLRAWAESALDGIAAPLAEHAILRGDAPAALRHAALLPPSHRAAVTAAAHFLAGDRPAADRAIDEALAGRTTPACGTLAPVLALLLLERDDAKATARARRLAKRADQDVDHGIARAFRTFLRQHERNAVDERSLDVHQLPPDASPWHLLLTGFAAHFRLERDTSRASWAVVLVRRGLAYHELGYRWLARQTWRLADKLHPAQCRAELPREHALPDEPSLWDRIAPKPDWARTLGALAKLSRRVARRAETAYRVAWFIDMPSVTLGRPLLQKADAEGGWSVGRRVALSELEPILARLPPEDREVARRLQSPAPTASHADAELEALDALVGHARVYRGDRGTTPVAIVRGRGRIETRDVRGGIAVTVQPRRATAGLYAVPEGDDRVVVYRIDEAFAQLAATLPDELHIPAEGEGQLLAVLAELASGVDVLGPHLAAEQTLVANATPCVRIAVSAGAFVAQVGVRPFGDRGRWLAAGAGPRAMRLVRDGLRLRCERDLDRERAERAALLAACPSLSPIVDEDRDEQEQDLWSFDEEGLLGLLSELATTSLPHDIEWRGSRRVSLTGEVSRTSLQGHLRAVKGWYLAEGVVHLDRETRATLAELAAAPALAGGRFLRVAPGAYVEVQAHLIRSMTALRAAAKKGSAVRVPGAALPALAPILDGGLRADEATTEFQQRLERARRARPRVPSTLKATLRDYQRDGYRWLRTLGDLEIGACLADDMGLGKTVQVIAALLAYQKHGPSLVVAPTSVCTNWLLELARFAPSLDVVDHAGPDRAERLAPKKGTVVVTSYALLQQDAERLAEIDWEVAVLDEAQLIKNAASKRARAAYGLRARRRIAATGTPVENHVGDLWAIFRFLEPGLLGDWRNFRRAFVRPIERDGSEQARESLRGLVDGYILRRLKKDVLASLPPLTELVHQVTLTEEETALHTALQRQTRERLRAARGRGGHRGHEVEVLAAITKLRRFCCHPQLAFPELEVPSSKIEALLGLVEELRENGHRALVFSQFVDFLELVTQHLDERAIAYEYLDGSTPRAARQARVDAFQEGDATLFVISLKAGGFGLNLTGADFVIHLDPWWNPAVQDQATDRAHRIGQHRPVTVYRLVTRGTIEERIVALQARKRDLADAVLAKRDLGALSPQDLITLLGLSPEPP